MSKSNVRTMLEILHRVENDHCMECPEQAFPCRTLALLDCGERMDRLSVTVTGLDDEVSG